jgi:enterochelin esterase-like enzyme
MISRTVRFLFAGVALGFLSTSPGIASFPRAGHAHQQPGARGTRCPAFEEFLKQVNQETQPNAKKLQVDQFLACVRQQDLPLIEESMRAGFGRAIFLYRGASAKVQLTGDMTGTVPGPVLERLSGTDISFYSGEFEMDARLDYKFVLNDKDWILDPLNPRIMPSGFGPNSQFWMPDYKPLKEIEANPAIPHGVIEDVPFASVILHNTRTLKVYLPPRYPEAGRRYPVLYVQDGTDYIKYANIGAVVDNLISEKIIPPILLVMAPPVDRNHEYDRNADFAKAFAGELVPMIDKRYATNPAPHSRAMLGASLGGLISAYIAANYPDIFGSFAGQSSAFLHDDTFDMVKSFQQHKTRIHLDIGTYEYNLHGSDLLIGNRKVRDALAGQSYPLEYLEVHEGHSWGSWRARIPIALKFLFGSRSNSAAHQSDLKAKRKQASALHKSTITPRTKSLFAGVGADLKPAPTRPARTTDQRNLSPIDSKLLHFVNLATTRSRSALRRT